MMNERFAVIRKVYEGINADDMRESFRSWPRTWSG